MKAKVKKSAPRRILIPRKYVEQVERGVKLLDILFGRKVWLRRMKMGTFDITEPEVCVAGNVFKDTNFFGEDGYDKFIRFLAGIEHGDTYGVGFGFSSTTDKGFQYLQDLWVMKIKKLKAAAKRSK